MKPYSLYLHIPFCTHRCAYCDFNTYAGQEEMIPAYVEALCKEIEFVGSRAATLALHVHPSALPARASVTGDAGPGRWDGDKGKVHTIFFGGGTPSLLS